MKPVNSLGFEPSRWVAAVINSSTSYDTDPRLSDGFSCSRRAYRIFCGRSLHDRSFWADGIQPKGWVAEKGLILVHIPRLKDRTVCEIHSAHVTGSRKCIHLSW
jgi:hypothetical protein